MTTNQRLLALTANMPCKQINLPGRDPVISFGSLAPDLYVGAGEILPVPHECEIFYQEAPYLQRYYAGTTRDNKDVWLHRFLSADSERHLHCHPFEFSAWIINGGYEEQRLNRATKEKESVYHGVINADIDSIEKFCKRINHGIEQARPWSIEFMEDNGHGRCIDVFDWHRIETAKPETWTALIVDPERLPAWFFIDDNGALEMRNSSARDWWKSYGVRGENRGDVL